MIQDINSHITEEKYTKIMLPKTIPENMLNHFIRGLFDAKGQFDVNENGTAYFSLILPNKRLAEDCQKILMRHCNLEKTPIMNNKQRTRFTINYSGDSARRIMEYLYTDATVYLDRKYEKFQHLRTNMN